MENWKNIAIAPNYMISDKGRVLRVSQIKAGEKVNMLKPERHTRNYRRVSLCLSDGTVRRQYIHRLVAEHFIGSPPPGVIYACHKDGDPSNNCVENIYWGTPKDNVRDARMHGTFKPLTKKIGSRHHNAKLTEEKVRKIRQDHRPLKAVAKDYGIHFGTVHSIRTGKSWVHVKA